MEISSRAAALHNESIVIDCHSDILMAVADGRVKLGERTVVEGVTTRDVRGHYDLPRWREGGVTLQVCALFIRHAEIHYALARGIDMVAGAYREIAANEGLVLAETVADIRKAKRDGKVALMLSFEGVDPLGNSLELLPVFHKLGVRMASLTHARRNYFSGGVMSGVDELAGLTPVGRDAIRMMNALGIVVDVRHMDARAIAQTLEISTKPVIFSHVNAIEAFPRDPEDAPHFPFTMDKGVDRYRMMQDIAASGGVIAVIFWRHKSVEDLLDNFVYVAEAVGPQYLALGTDFYGFDMVAEGMEDVSKFPALTERLLGRGFSEEEVRGILGENMMRVFDEVLEK
jgi:membrane dipeptidase